MLVAIAERISIEYAIHDALSEIRDFCPGVANRLAQQGGMAGSGNTAIGVVVDHPAFAPPLQRHRYRRTQHQRHHRAQVFRPLPQLAHRGALPVKGADQPGELRAFGEEGKRIGSGVFSSHAGSRGKRGSVRGRERYTVSRDGRDGRYLGQRRPRQSRGIHSPFYRVRWQRCEPGSDWRHKRQVGMRHFIKVGGSALLAVALAACSPPAPVLKQASKALPPTVGTSAARYVHTEADRHQDESGFRLLMRSTNALMSRVALADHAQHSLDLQYYVFDNDATGRLMAQRLLAAADRGVRVRLLVDDINAGDAIDLFDALDTHPNIEVRLFNPSATKKPSMLSKATQFLLDAHRLNRRMHNKSFIADGNVAIVGGRNIGDAYFDAGDNTNFRDLDLIAIGPVVQQAEHAFDAYWNCDAAYPVKAFGGKHADHYDLAKLRVQLAHDARKFAQSDYA